MLAHHFNFDINTKLHNLWVNLNMWLLWQYWEEVRESKSFISRQQYRHFIVTIVMQISDLRFKSADCIFILFMILSLISKQLNKFTFYLSEHNYWKNVYDLNKIPNDNGMICINCDIVFESGVIYSTAESIVDLVEFEILISCEEIAVVKDFLTFFKYYETSTILCPEKSTAFHLIND